MAEEKFNPRDTNKDGEVSLEERNAWREKKGKDALTQEDLDERTGNKGKNKGKGKEKDVSIEADVLSKEELADRYNYALRVIYADPELTKLFERALNAEKGQWTPDKFAAELKDTKWYRKGVYFREAFVAEKTGGGDWRTSKQNARNAVQDAAIRMGADVDKATLDALATRYIYEGWGREGRQVLLDRELTKYLNDSKGANATSIDSLKAYANSFGVKMDDGWYEAATKSMLNGRSVLDTWQAEIRNTAKSKYPALTTQIDAGQTTRAAMGGYLNSMGSILEIDPNSIDFDDPTFSKAWGKKQNPDGTPALMSLFDFEKELRNDSRWESTKNGRQTLMDSMYTFTRSLGFGDTNG